MRLRLITNIAIVIGGVASAHAAAPPVDLELATERGVQITAPHEWLQLLTAIGIDNVRIRGTIPGDEPKISNRGTAARPRYHVVGILTARHQLQLPGETFARSDRARLQDYFKRLAADGADSLTAPRGRFGITEQELAAVLADLSQPIDFETTGLAPQVIADRLATKFKVKLLADASAVRELADSKPVVDEWEGVSAGSGLAMILRGCGLALRPEKERGEPVALRIETADGEALADTPAGDPDDLEMTHWPIGWKPPQTPGRTAPSLFEPRNAEIDGYSLDETLTAITARIKVPLYLDHSALAAHRIEPSKVQVRLARTRSTYKRIIDRVLLQARLRSHLRVDEAGAPFLWVTR